MFRAVPSAQLCIEMGILFGRNDFVLKAERCSVPRVIEPAFFYEKGDLFVHRDVLGQQHRKPPAKASSLPNDG
jgi:hypothetical protein